jgi:GNAT superfamily N-acetyltransferase
MIAINKIELPVPGIDTLLAEARAEGYDFIDTLIDDWTSGANRFDGPGEVLLGCFDGDELVAVGGLNRDPFVEDPGVGRVRRVYVRSAWRNQGVGAALVSALVEHARAGFRVVRLRAENSGAARLYERLGFVAIAADNATHVLLVGNSR